MSTKRSQWLPHHCGHHGGHMRISVILPHSTVRSNSPKTRTDWHTSLSNGSKSADRCLGCHLYECCWRLYKPPANYKPSPRGVKEYGLWVYLEVLHVLVQLQGWELNLTVTNALLGLLMGYLGWEWFSLESSSMSNVSLVIMWLIWLCISLRKLRLSFCEVSSECLAFWSSWFISSCFS